MFRPRVIPCLLVLNNGLVKTVGFKNPTYVGDPINSVKIFNDLEADELVFLDISASREKRTILADLVKQIGDEAYMPFAVGGGIFSIEQIRELLSAGAEKVVINTAAVNNPDLIGTASDLFGSQSIIVAIDVKKTFGGHYKVLIKDGTVKTSLDPVVHAREMACLGAGEILVNSIDRDGTGAGYDIELIKKISEAVEVPVIALGGAGKPEDFAAGINLGKASAVAAGSMFVFYGPKRAVLINYPEKKNLEGLFSNT